MRNSFESMGSEAYRSPEKPKNPSVQLKEFISTIAEQQNREALQYHGLENLLDEEGKIVMSGYEDVLGQGMISESAHDVRDYEVEFSGADRPNMQDFYRTQHKIEGEEAIIQKWKENKAKNKNYLMELVVTALFHKTLRDRYFVVGTSDYDDYRNGVDTLIIDKETGTVVCAFDEVHEGGAGERTQQKLEKVLKKVKRGGAKIRFWIKN